METQKNKIKARGIKGCSENMDQRAFHLVSAGAKTGAQHHIQILPYTLGVITNLLLNTKKPEDPSGNLERDRKHYWFFCFPFLLYFSRFPILSFPV